MVEAWEKVAPEQRISELIDLIEKQKSKDFQHEMREDEMEKKYMEKIIELSNLIEFLAKHMLQIEKRVSELEKK
jgi:hypothetical protein